MKKHLSRILLGALCAAVLLLAAAATDTDACDYYDYTRDGRVELVDTLALLHDQLNSNADISLLRVLRSLKAATDSRIVSGTVKAVTADGFSVTQGANTVSVSVTRLGLHAADDLTSYVGFPITLSLSATDAARVYAAKIDRDVNTVSVVTAGSTVADLCGAAVTLEAAPFFREDTLLVPARFVAEAVGASVAWNRETQTAILEKGDISLAMSMDSTAVTVNGKTVTAPAAATIVENRTYLPLAFVAEVFGAKTVANGDTLTVIDYAKTVLYTKTTTAKAGETVSVPILLKNSPGITGLQFSVGYDARTFTYGGVQNGNSGMFCSASDKGANPVKVVLANLSLKEKVGNFTVVSLTFTVSETAAPGTYTLSLGKIDAYDKDIVAVPTIAETVTVTVE